MLSYKTIEDFNLQDKKIIIRVDFNVPITNGKITDESRIIESIPTIKYALENGAKEVILLSHLGKIKKEEDKVKNDLRIVIPVLEEQLGMKVDFIEHTSGVELIDDINKSKTRVKLIQNIRFEDLKDKKESKNDKILGAHLATLATIAIFDGWGVSHRNHASTSAMFKNIECGVGFLVEKELKQINGFLSDATHPFTIIMGGAKVEDKIGVINNLIDKCDKLLIGGAMAFTFLKAQGYNVGKSLVDEQQLDYCKNLLSKYKDKIVLPVDFVTDSRTCKIDEFKDDEIGFDIGCETLEIFKKELATTVKILINGTMGKNEEEKYENGTKNLFNFLSSLANNGVKILVGGGDTASAAYKYELAKKVYHVSTGGGATLKYLANELGDIFYILDASVKENGFTRNKKIGN